MATTKRVLTGFYEHLRYLGHSDEVEIFTRFPANKDVKLKSYPEDDKHFTSVSKFIDSYDYTYWLMRFKNKLNDIRFTYILVAFAYHSGIPDKDWMIHLENGKSKFYTDLLTDKQFINYFLFDYYAEFFFYQLFSSLDILNKCIDKLYSLHVDPNPNQFNKNVLKALKPKDKQLHDAITTFYDQSKNSRKLRNNFTHDFPANEIACEAEKTRDA